MKRNTIIMMITGIILGLAYPADKIKSIVDNSRSSVNWTASKISGDHTGGISMKESYVEIENHKLIGGKFVFDMNSITNTDVTSEEWNAKLVGHLKAEDFFDVEHFPLAVFNITKALAKKPSAEDKSNYLIQGDLTIKDITHPIEFSAKLHFHNTVGHAEGSITVDRTLWDIQYRSGKFFENLGDKLIYDNFVINFNVKTNK